VFRFVFVEKVDYVGSLHINSNKLMPIGKWLFYRMKSDNSLSDHSSLPTRRPQYLHTTDQELNLCLRDGKTERRGTRISVIQLIEEPTSQAPIWVLCSPCVLS